MEILTCERDGQKYEIIFVHDIDEYAEEAMEYASGNVKRREWFDADSR